MMLFCRTAMSFALCALASAAFATQAKIDADTCTQLRLEQIKFRQSGILDDIGKGADWAKTNLSAERLHDIQTYMALDEQVKFGCRDAKLSAEAQKASEAAERIEMNSDADPAAVPASPSVDGDGKQPQPQAQVKPKKPAQKKASQKIRKVRPADTGAETQNTPDPKENTIAVDGAAAATGAIVVPQAAPVGAASGTAAPETPALGFGEPAGLPRSSQ